MSKDSDDDIGKIIAKVQDDLEYLRDATRGHAGETDAGVDAETLDMILTRTQQGMQTVAERVLQTTQDRITTLPAIARRGNVQNNIKSDPHSKVPKQGPQRSDPLPDLSAGQFCLVKHMSQLVAQPSNPLTHKVLAHYYDLPSQDTNVATPSAKPGQVLVGTTVDHLTTLPKSNRINPLLTPPPISQDDAGKGLLSLLERGLIPPAAEIVLSPPPVDPQPLRLHTPSKQHVPQKVADGNATQLVGVKLDSKPTSIQIPSVPKPEVFTPAPQAPQETPTLCYQTLKIPEPPADLLQLPSLASHSKAPTYKIIVQNGHLVEGTKDFLCFKKEQRKRWNEIIGVLKQVMELCRDYAVPLCIVDCNRLLSLSMEYELELPITKDDLLATMINRRDVQELLSYPGQRYRGHDGKHAAATKIRATFLMYKLRKEYLDYRRRKWAAGVLSLAWLTFIRMHTIKQKLKLQRLAHLEAHRARTADLRKRWAEIQRSKRTIIHMASQGFSQAVRDSIPKFQIEQSLQLGRLCDIQDPNVEVIYVSPTPLGEEIAAYYHTLLAMGPAGTSSKDRVHFVHPEHLESFKCHNMALSTLVLYSPLCFARIKRLIAGREAYIISATVAQDDLAMACKLGIPLLGSEPDTSQLYSTKPGARRLFRSAGVPLPPYEVDIFSQEQMLKSLATLIANNLLVTRWIFKLPDQVKGHGFAHCNVIEHLPCYTWVVKEAKRYGSKWTKCWAQEQALKKISSFLPEILSEHAQMVETTLYPTWKDFLTAFLQAGGIIEAAPPSDSLTSIAVDIFIDPTQDVTLYCTLDQIFSGSYRVCGGTVPQSSVPHSQLMEVVDNVATACKERGILGHLTIDLLTFIDPTSMNQVLWCVDLDVGYSNHLALHRLMTYMTGCQLDTNSGTLLGSEDEVDRSRYAVLTPHLYHTNLSLLYHSTFFQMCKAHLIGYDPSVKLGTVFNLAADNQQRNYLGMICVKRTLLQAVQTCSSNLSIIHQEISTTSMQGYSNFKEVIGELDKIIELINSNSISG